MFIKNTTISLVLVFVLVLSAEVADADFIWGTPTNLGPTINSSGYEGRPSVSADGLTLYFVSTRRGQGLELWSARRPVISEPWGTPVNLGPAVKVPGARYPSISGDGLSLYFHSDQAGFGSGDIFVATRTNIDDPWSGAVNLGPPVNSSASERFPNISADGLSLYFSDYPNLRGGYGDSDIWVTTRTTTEDDWGTPVNLGPTVNTSKFEGAPSISADGLTLFFESTEDPSAVKEDLRGNWDLWVTTRATIHDDWSTPVKLPPNVNAGNTFEPGISGDGSTLYFCSNRSGGQGFYDLWQVPIEPLIDLNGDGIVDAADMCIIVDDWHTESTLCDVAPAPFGDGFVDVKDLVVLAEHLFEAVDDPTLVAHWTLDETEGSIAHESISGNADLVMGDALWQPTGGVVGGALELDGVDDCIITGFGLNLADGAFSIVAWVKGGGPGQVVISEPMGTNWLVADVEGKLMTELKSAGRHSTALLSQAVITDGTWHRIGFVWDGSQRMLCVDGATVAEDTQNGLETFDAGLYIGVGNDYAPGSFFCGMVDDVRIYNRVVRP